GTTMTAVAGAIVLGIMTTIVRGRAAAGAAIAAGIGMIAEIVAATVATVEIVARIGAATAEAGTAMAARTGAAAAMAVAGITAAAITAAEIMAVEITAVAAAITTRSRRLAGACMLLGQFFGKDTHA